MPRSRVTTREMAQDATVEGGYWARYPSAWSRLLSSLEKHPLAQVGYGWHAHELTKYFGEAISAEAVRSKIRQQRRLAAADASQASPPSLLVPPYQAIVPASSATVAPFTTDKKKPVYDWRQKTKTLIQQQTDKQFARPSQHVGNVTFQNTRDPICIVTLSDLHIGSPFVNYRLLEKITDEILGTPNLFVLLAGDTLNMAIRMRGVKEVKEDMIDAEEQHWFFDSWLKELRDRLLAGVWDNHAVERQEEMIGYSPVGEMIAKYCLYSQGLFHIDLHAGAETYKMVFSHRFRTRGADPLTGQKTYIMKEAPDREIAIAGDSHTPAYGQYWYAGLARTAINTGTTENGEYSSRNFSLTQYPVFPCFTIDPDEHIVTPYPSVRAFVKHRG